MEQTSLKSSHSHIRCAESLQQAGMDRPLSLLEDNGAGTVSTYMQAGGEYGLLLPIFSGRLPLNYQQIAEFKHVAAWHDLQQLLEPARRH